MTRKRLYLDVDGVLIGKHDPQDMFPTLARGALTFLGFCLEHFECVWLSTHSQPGTTEYVLRHLDSHAEPADKDLLGSLASRIAPSYYKTLKVEALEGDFLWVDDQPIASEIEFLRTRGWLDRWIQVNTNRQPDGLLQVRERLQAILDSSGGSQPGASPPPRPRP